MRKQAGFTLIELVMVIVILGILAATALPRFANLQADARAASRDGIAGGVRAAAAIAHAESLIRGVSTGNITLEGQTVALVNGYPAATAAGIGAAAGVDGVDATYVAGPPAVATWTVNADCTVTYEGAGAGGAPTIGGDDTCS